MNRFELIFCAPFLPIFAIASAIDKRRSPFAELRRLCKNWKLHWEAA